MIFKYDVEILVTIFLVTFTIYAIHLLWANSGGFRLVEVMWPSLGALALSGFLFLKEIITNTPSNFSDKIHILQVETKDNTAVPLHYLLKKKPSVFNSLSGLNEFYTQWVKTFQENPGLKEQLKQPEYSLDFFEICFWKWMHLRYNNVWIVKEDEPIDITSWGISRQDDINRKLSMIVKMKKYLLNRNSILTNKFPTDLALAVPLGTKITNQSDDHKKKIVFETRFSELIVTLQGGVVTPLQPFKLIGQQEHDHPFAKIMFDSFKGTFPDKLKSTDDFYKRTWQINIYQKFNGKYGFSEQADIEKKWGMKLSDEIRRSFSWNRVLPELEKLL